MILSAILACSLYAGSEKYDLYVPTVKSVIASKDIVKLNNGKLEFQGKKIMDEDGDIIMGANINNKLYYFSTKEFSDTQIVFLKDSQGKIIKKFEGYRINLSKNEENLPLILLQLSKDSNAYDNVYLFDGENVQLINKNLVRYNYEFYGAGHVIIPKVESNMKFHQEYFPLKSITDGSEKTISVLHPFVNIWGSARTDSYTIITSAGANIVYLYDDVNRDTVLETFNVKTGERKTLAKGDGWSGDVFQVLYSNGIKILRIFKDKTLKEEYEYKGQTPVSKYDDKESTYIDLSTLNEVEINPKDFNKLVIDGVNEYSVNGERHITFYLHTLANAVDKRRNGYPLF